jgi:hypothetical protein
MKFIGFLLVLGSAFYVSSDSSVFGFIAAWLLISAGVMLGGVVIRMMSFVKSMSVARSNSDEAVDTVLIQMSFWMWVGMFFGGFVASLLASAMI